MRVIPLLVVLAATGVGAQQRATLPKGTSSVRGKVIDLLSGQPVSGCQININESRLRRSGSSHTADDGTYEFAGIIEGEYTMGADCLSHLRTCYRLPDESLPCSVVSVLKDQKRVGVDFHVKPGATARGRVVDSSGAAVPRATVRLGPPVRGDSFNLTMPTTTKEDGTFELMKLPDGEWRLEVEIPATATVVRPPTVYYPGVFHVDDALPIELVAGKTLADISIVVPRFLENELTVRLPPPDETMKDVVVKVIRPEPLIVRSIELDAEGVGTVKGLLEGRYFVEASGRAIGRPWVAHEVVDFVEGTHQLALQLRPAGSIRGTVVSESGGLPTPSGMRISAALVYEDVEINPIEPDQAGVAADGTFQLAGMFGRRRLDVIGLDPQWTVVNVRQGRSHLPSNAVDVPFDTTIEVTIVVGKR